MREILCKKPISELIEKCEKLGLEFVNVLYEKFTYVEFVCKKHSYKGVQKINRESLYHWAEKGRCMCALTNRDEEDLKRDPLIAEEVEIIGKYQKANIPIECRCKRCGKFFKATPNKLQQGRRCSFCRFEKQAEKLRYSQEEFEEKLQAAFPEFEVVGEYTGMRNPIYFKCKNCGEEQFCTAAHRVLSGERGCSFCKGTKGERRVAACLKEWGIEFQTQKSFEECKSLKPLRFDFYIPSSNACVEYQGEQHYFPVDFRGKHDGSEIEAHDSLKERDEIKRSFCLEKGLTLIEIPYWDIDNVEKYLSVLRKVS